MYIARYTFAIILMKAVLSMGQYLFFMFKDGVGEGRRHLRIGFQVTHGQDFNSMDGYGVGIRVFNETGKKKKKKSSKIGDFLHWYTFRGSNPGHPD